jgi:hypothetical protein
LDVYVARVCAAHVGFIQSPYATDEDFILPTLKLKGRKPPRANMLVADHLKPAARRAGVKGNVGFHTFLALTTYSKMGALL